jgi:hypothetical protein
MSTNEINDDDDDDDKKPAAHTIDDDGTKQKTKNNNKKKKKQKSPPTCNVIAPETMAGGTKFETDVDGIKFIAIVPDGGGVTKGSTFTVPYPSTSSKSFSKSSKSKSNNNNNNNSKITSATATSIQIPSVVQATLVIPEEELVIATAVTAVTTEYHQYMPINTIRVIAPDTLNGGSIFEAHVNMNTFIVTVPYGGVTKGQMFDVPYPTSFTNTINPTAATTVQVMAPSTMNGGQMFEAQVDGIKFIVTVPQNGINKGELFTVPYPTTTGGESLSLSTGGPANNNITNVVNAYDIPTPDDTWRTEICDCFANNSNGCCLCLMGFFCSPIVMAQLMQRMKYNLGGGPVRPNGNGYEYVCIVISTITIFLFPLIFILSYITRAIGYLLLSGWFIYLIIISTCTRYSMRKKYNIKYQCLCCNVNGYGNENDNCCDGIEDCCIVYWCTCCSAIQMISHTHDGRKYPYNPCNQTGIDTYAPDINIV